MRPNSQDPPTPSPGPPPERAAEPPISPEVAAFGRLLHQHTPKVWVTHLLVAANLAVYAVMVFTGVHFFQPTGPDLVKWGANFGIQTLSGEWWRLATCMFVHIGILHILFNMYVLWDAGRLVERLLGNGGFAVVYLVSGLAGSVTSLAWKPVVISAGASGAIFGVYGALLGFVVLQRRSLSARAALSGVGRSAVTFILFNVAFGFSMKGIDMAAHLGGLGAGFLCGLGLSHPLEGNVARSRLIRGIAVLVIGGGAIAASTFLIPRGSANLGLALEKVAGVEKQVIGRYNDTVRAIRSGKKQAGDLLVVLEKDILPQWKKVKEEVRRVGKLPEMLERRRRKIVTYMDTREAAWVLQSKSLRELDLNAAMKAREKAKEADQLAKEIIGK